MSARIAPEPIQANVAGLGARPSLFDSLKLDRQSEVAEPAAGKAQAETTQTHGLAPLPAPPPPPGSIFAMALLSGQLSPRPMTEQEVIQRLGSARLPAQGSLALRDRLV